MIESFLKYLLAEKQYSKLTISSYRGDISQFCSFMGTPIEEFDFAAVDHKDIRSFVMSLSEQGMSSTTINRKLSTLKSLYRYLSNRKMVEINPTTKVSSLRSGLHLPHFVDKPNMDRLIASSIENSDNFNIEQDKTIITLFLTTGMRLAELIGMNISDINFASSELLVRGKGGKERLIPLCSLVVNKLRHYLYLRDSFEKELVVESDTLFINIKGKRVSRSSLYLMVNQTLMALGIDGKCSPHVLRHTFATHLLGAGVGIESVKELLGHASLSTTQIYAHNSIEQLIDMRNKYFPEE